MQYSEFTAYREQIEDLSGTSDFSFMMHKILLTEGLMALKLIRPRTPVDSGTLRRNWALGNVTVSGNIARIEIVNPTSYAAPVEYGWTKPSGAHYVGAHMAEVSMDIISKQIDDRVRGQFEQWLQAHLTK
jgi:hypothetical protein